ncbi:PIN domain-containing protein [Bosea caraganae]|uniref:PIN domain-containing protein n=1 Tax=Bosea caraganae TaxID=2763117 RepID=A0A370L3J8_9HYPH|nr:PIN domain-containing protein [Bosea caraganae]RDJ22920.1 PIN domain-containing protein [Bosea caraganae]RDJ28700.1 PIN domain-containing protein [Bosea caraganae]
MTRAFLDTNILVYAFSDDARNAVAEQILGKGGEISIQVVNEFSNVARRKLGFDWLQISEAVDAIRTLARGIHLLDLETHAEAIRLADRYGFSFYDALIVASALRAKCDLLYTEDMQSGLLVDGTLRIENPFQPG